MINKIKSIVCYIIGINKRNKIKKGLIKLAYATPENSERVLQKWINKQKENEQCV